jgi:hypothetical protein
MFGYKAVAKFLRDNKLIYMLRAHEVQEEGFRSHFASPGTGLGKLYEYIYIYSSSIYINIYASVHHNI